MSSERRTKMNQRQEVTHELVRPIGVLTEKQSGWTKELNLVSWNGAEPKYDIREWSADREKMSRGITLTAEEAKILAELLKEEQL